MRRPVLALLVCGVGVSLPSVALAASPKLEPGVHVDPGSPAGKQYQIPIASARSEAAGGAGATNSTAPAFGIGVTPSGGSASTADATSQRSHGSSHAARPGRGHATRRRFAGSAAAGSSKNRDGAATVAASSGGGGRVGGDAWPVLAAGGLLVLVLGGGGGLALRRRADR
jgi:hypothetical protein